MAVSHSSTNGLGWSRVKGYRRVPEPPTVARTWGNMLQYPRMIFIMMRAIMKAIMNRIA
jgi:hypothetical protein